jgi:beta-glucosidase
MSAIFPKNFLWGSATHAHQVEGNNHNDWAVWEKENAAMLARTAQKRWNEELRMKGVSVPLPEAAFDPSNYISGNATDHYNRFREDFDIAKSLGHNGYHFSLEWSRIEPEEGKFNKKEIAHYHEVLSALKERRITPMVCLSHWTLPIWIPEKGGIVSSKFPDYFARYVRRVVNEYKDMVTLWQTFNEPTVPIGAGYIAGAFPPQRKNLLLALRAYKTLASAHRKVYKVIHEISPSAQVGFAAALWYLEPYTRSTLDKIACNFIDYWFNRHFLKLTKDTNDYLAIQYYDHIKIKFPVLWKSEAKDISDMGSELFQEGLYYWLMRLKKYNLPIYITENGIADAEDKYRAEFIRDAVHHMKRALKEGVDLRGYFYWSLTDNFEWNKGYWPRFGLVEIDYKTKERKIRKSAEAYRDIILKERG